MEIRVRVEGELVGRSGPAFHMFGLRDSRDLQQLAVKSFQDPCPWVRFETFVVF
jgi:hypothetical protein